MIASRNGISRILHVGIYVNMSFFLYISVSVCCMLFFFIILILILMLKHMCLFKNTHV